MEEQAAGQGLSNGVRELMLLVPDGRPGQAWQTRVRRTQEELYQLAANIFLYAVDKSNLPYKGETYIVNADKGPKLRPTARSRSRGSMVGDNWDPEPGGWRRLANVMHNDGQDRR